MKVAGIMVSERGIIRVFGGYFSPLRNNVKNRVLSHSRYSSSGISFLWCGYWKRVLLVSTGNRDIFGYSGKVSSFIGVSFGRKAKCPTQAQLIFSI
jgi:hypothetical protein